MAEQKNKVLKDAAELNALFEVSAAAVGRAYAFVAQDGIRYYLNSVALFAGKDPVVVGTNGAIMYVEEDADGAVTQDIIISVSKRGRSLLKGANRVQILIRGGVGTLSIRTSHGIDLYVEPGDCIVRAKYPDYRAVVPAYKDLAPGMVGNFKTDLLKKVCQMPGGIEFFHSTKSDPHKAAAVWTHEFEGGGKALGVLMPMRPSLPAAERWPSALQR